MSNIKHPLLLALTLMLSGRAMTLAFVGRSGGSSPGDPPAAWLMPLVGDAIIGISALFIAYLILRGTGLFAWTAIVTWNVLGIWDALSAYLINLAAPWPSFFMIETLGASMFFAASAMHVLCIILICRNETRRSFLPQMT